MSRYFFSNTKIFYEKRINNIMEKLDEYGIDAIVLIDPSNIFYVSGIRFYFQEMNIPLGTWASVLISKEAAKLIIFVSEIEHARNVDWMEKVVYDDIGGGFRLIKQLSNKIGILGIEGDYMPYTGASHLQRIMPKTRLTDSGSLISELRRIKDRYEIRLMERAAKIADEAMAVAMEYVKPGRTEIDIAIAAEEVMQKNGAEDLAFKTVVTSGKRAEMLNWLATSRKIGLIDCVIIDLGAKYKGYCSDLTRTVQVGNVKPEFKEIAEAVMEARQHVIETVKPGVEVNKIDALVQEIMAIKGYEKYCHHPSHGIGIDCVEQPLFSPLSKLIFKPNMTYMIEIGIHIPKLGGYRVEDMFLITPKGVKQLTQCRFHQPKIKN